MDCQPGSDGLVIIFGFTGTRKGLTGLQVKELRSFLLGEHVQELHHGGCVGADADVHKLIKKDVRLRYIPIHLHPGLDRAGNSPMRASLHAEEQYPPLPYLERNRVIVDMSDYLIACPGGPSEELRSGTWATVRYALKKAKPVAIIYPDGRVEFA